jgi:putative oxidoreductase
MRSVSSLPCSRFSPGRRHALMAGLAETGGGLLLALGFLTPLAAALLCSIMLVAAISVHIKKGFFVTNGGYEYTLVLGIAAIALAFTGPGSFSLDARVGHYLSGTRWGAAALFVAALGGVFALVQRRPAPTQQAASGE